MEVFTKDNLIHYHGQMKEYIKQNSTTVDGSVIEKSDINGNIKIDGVETVVYSPKEYYVEY